MIRVPLDVSLMLPLLTIGFLVLVGGVLLLSGFWNGAARPGQAATLPSEPLAVRPLHPQVCGPAEVRGDAGLIFADAGGMIVGLDDHAADLAGCAAEGLPIGLLLPELVCPHAPGGLRTDIGESALLHASGRRSDVDVMVVPWQEAGWLIAVRDGSARRRRMLELERLALHDPLTSLANRALFVDRAEQAMVLAERHGEPCAVMLLDLDRFKQVNDTLGHDIGDLLLREVAPRLAAPLRRTDTLARFGGDEFAVLLPPPTSAAEAGEVAHRLVQAMASPFLIEGFSLGIGVSIGVALRPRHGLDLEELLRSADEAMYAAKRDALGYLLAGEPRELGVIRRPALRNDLERAIAERSLSIHFQPKVEAGSRRLTGFEGLLRWDHPAFGRLQPDMFLPVAERARLMGPLTEFVLDECLRRQQEWRQLGFHLEVAVNLAAFWVRDEWLVDQIAEALRRWNARACELTLDVGEGSIMSDPVCARERLGQFRDLGCRVAMDDFGTGYSSLTQLQRLPLDEIKVHRSFIAPLEQDLRSARVVLRSIVGIAEGLGLAATAEGVESEQVARAAAELGCARLQGFLVAEPMSAAAALDWLRCWPAGVAGPPVPHKPEPLVPLTS